MDNKNFPRKIYNEEHLMFRDTVRQFIEKEIAPYHAQWEKDKMISREVWKKAGEMGFLGLSVPEEFGGSDLNDYRFNALLCEELNLSGYTGPALGFCVHTDIAVPYVIKYANEETKKKFLPGLTDGSLIGSIAMSEPGAGSDLQNIRTTAIDKGDHYLVNGSKTFISNGYQCNVAITAVKTNPNEGAKGTTMLLIDDSLEGFTKGKPFEKIGLHAQDTCELFFEDVKVPKTQRLGAEGQGFALMMQDLPQERLIVAISAVAAAEGCLNHTIQYVKDRMAFGKPVAAFQNTRHRIAELATECAIARIFIDHCVELHDAGELTSVAASMAKYNMTDLQCRVIDECVQLHGGYGYMWEYYVARAFADARAQRIYAGTNEIMKELISRDYLR